jgi:agmatine deiminase
MQRRGFMMAGMATGLALAGNMARSAGAARFRVPAEESLQEMAIMQWPVSPAVYSDTGFLRLVQATIADIANAISAFQPVIMLADQAHHAVMRKQLSAQVTLWDVPTDDLWARDSGPIVAVDGQGNRAVKHIRFNGWGGRQEHRHDALIAKRVAERLGFPVIASALQGEAGGVEQDGHGLLIAHESSWVNDNRNPGMTRDAVGAALLADFGADRILWAPGLKDEDITDYHIDSLLRLTGPGRALVNMPAMPDADDPFHIAAAQTLEMVKAAGLNVDIIFEPERRRVKSIDFVASYANYFVCNGAVIAAQFGDAETDAAAVSAIQRHFPGREVVTLNVDALGESGGGIHCATHEVPVA